MTEPSINLILRKQRLNFRTIFTHLPFARHGHLGRYLHLLNRWYWRSGSKHWTTSISLQFVGHALLPGRSPEKLGSGGVRGFRCENWDTGGMEDFLSQGVFLEGHGFWQCPLSCLGSLSLSARTSLASVLSSQLQSISICSILFHVILPAFHIRKMPSNSQKTKDHDMFSMEFR